MSPDCLACNGLGYGERSGFVCRQCGGSGVNGTGDPMCLDVSDHQEEHARATLLSMQREMRERELAWETWNRRYAKRERVIAFMYVGLLVIGGVLLALCTWGRR